MNYLQLFHGVVKGGIGNFRQATRKVQFPTAYEKDYNMRAVVPAKACKLLQIEPGNPWEFELSQDKQKLLCELALYRTDRTTDTIRLSNGATLVHIPARYKPFITKGTQILWRWNEREVYGEIPLTDFTISVTSNPFAIKRERREERKFRYFYGKPRKVPIWPDRKTRKKRVRGATPYPNSERRTK
jgi:hypothetical protein